MKISPLSLTLLPLLSLGVNAQMTAREKLVQLAGAQAAAQPIATPLAKPMLIADCFSDHLGRPSEVDQCLGQAFVNSKDVSSASELRLEKIWDCKLKVTADQKFFSFNTYYPLTSEIQFSGKSGILTMKVTKGTQVGFRGLYSPDPVLFRNGELMDTSFPERRVAFPIGVSAVYRLDAVGNIIMEEIAGPHMTVNGRPDFWGSKPYSRLTGYFSSDLAVVGYRYCVPQN